MSIPTVTPDQLPVLASYDGILVGAGARIGRVDIDANALADAEENAAIAVAARDQAVAAAANFGVPTITALRAVVPVTGSTAFLTEDGRAVRYVWRLGNYTARVAADPEGYEFVKADTISAGVGAWVAARDNDDLLPAVDWFEILRRTRTPAVIDQIKAGTFAGDLAVEWQAFRDALHAQFLATGRASGMIRECTIRTSVSPNFAIDQLKLSTQGQVTVVGIGATRGFYCDGTGLGYSGFGVVGMMVGPITSWTETGGVGIFVKLVHFSRFERLHSRGGSFAGVTVDACIVTKFGIWVSPTDGGPLVQNPTYGLYITGDGGTQFCSWCIFDMPVTEYVPTGIYVEQSYGHTFIGGTSEGNTSTGVKLASDASFCKFIGTDFEVNTNFDIDCEGPDNQFIGVDAGGTSRFVGAGATKNKIIGGKYSTLTFDASTTSNTVTNASVDTLTDSSTGAKRNRVSGVVGATGDFADRWISYTPSLSAEAGAFTSASTSGQYKISDGDTIHFRAQVAITTNGTAAGAVILGLPFAANVSWVFSGVEQVATGLQVSGSTFAASSTMRVVLSDGTYPGANGRTITVCGTYQRQ